MNRSEKAIEREVARAGKHLRTEWTKRGRHKITAAGEVVGLFRHTEDRDLVVDFANAYTSAALMLRSAVNDLEVIARLTDEPTVRKFATERSDLYRGFAADLLSLHPPNLSEG